MAFLKKYGGLSLLLCTAAVVSAVLISKVGSAVAAFGREQSEPTTVIIDAGHGGEDGGAVSVSGVRESGLNLEISLRLNDFLPLLGLHTKMVRTEDVSVHSPQAGTIAEKKASDIRNRVELVRQTPNALLLSIHQNRFSESKYRGAQVFYADNAESRALAESLQTDLRAQLDPDNHRQCKKAQDIYLLSHVDCAAVLVECGFLSNAEEELLLRDSAYQKKLTAAIGCCVLNYLEEIDEI